MSKITDELLAAARVVAPTIASFIPGGPLAVGAYTALSNLVLGKPDGKQDEITAAIGNMTPEQIATVRSGDQVYAAKMRELDITADKMVFDDRAGARSLGIALAGAKDHTVSILTAIIVIFALGTESFVILHGLGALDQTQALLVGRVLGTMDSALLMVLAYYYGTTQSSRGKDATIASAAAMLGNSTPTIIPADSK